MTGGPDRADPATLIGDEPLLHGLDLTFADLDRELSWSKLPLRVARALQGLWMEDPRATLGSTFRLRDFAGFNLCDLLNVRHVGVGTLVAVRPAIEAALVEKDDKLLDGLGLTPEDLDRELPWAALPARVARALQELPRDEAQPDEGSTFRLRDFAGHNLSDLLVVRNIGVGTLEAVRPAIAAAVASSRNRHAEQPLHEALWQRLLSDRAEERIDPDAIAVYGATKQVAKTVRENALTSFSTLGAYLQIHRHSRQKSHHHFREFANSLARQVDGREVATLEALYRTRLEVGPDEWPHVVMERFGLNPLVVADALPALDRESRAFEMRADGMTLEQIGKQLGVTRERARQLAAKVTPYVDSERARRSKEGPRRYRLMMKENEATQRHAMSEVARSLVLQQPGISVADLAERLGVEVQEARDLVPDHLAKFVLGHELKHGMSPFARHSKEQLLAAVRHAGTFYFPLSAPQYDELVAIGEIDAPGSQTVAKRFGTWKAACLAAGVEPTSMGRSLYDTKWSWDEVVNFVVEYLLSPETSGTYADYERWRSEQINAVPSGALVRNILDSWGEAVGLALLKIAESGPLDSEKYGQCPMPGDTQ
jgi:hypothetical protein